MEHPASRGLHRRRRQNRKASSSVRIAIFVFNQKTLKSDPIREMAFTVKLVSLSGLSGQAAISAYIIIRLGAPRQQLLVKNSWVIGLIRIVELC